MSKQTGWWPALNAGLLAGQGLALIFIGILYGLRHWSGLIPLDITHNPLLLDGVHVALVVSIWGGLTGLLAYYLQKAGYSGRHAIMGSWAVPLVVLCIQTIMPTASALITWAGATIPQETKDMPGFVDPTRHMLIFTFPTFIALLSWGLVLIWYHCYRRSLHNQTKDTLFPLELLDSPKVESSPIQKYIYYRTFGTAIVLVLIVLLVRISRLFAG